jgi:hypothetical protein
VKKEKKELKRLIIFSMKKVTNLGNVSLTELFTYDIVTQPSFVQAKVFSTETKSQIRKKKIKRLFK